MYHFDADAAEHLHHKGNATLQSQVCAPPPHPSRPFTHSLPHTSPKKGEQSLPPEEVSIASEKISDAALCDWGGRAGTMFPCKSIS